MVSSFGKYIMRTIIAVSGGLDSTYALWKLLETGDQITVVHLTGDELSARDLMRYDVRLLNSNQTKRDALSKIFSWLKANVRDFDVANVSVDGSLLRLGIEYPNSTQTMAHVTVAPYQDVQLELKLRVTVLLSLRREDGWISYLWI